MDDIIRLKDASQIETHGLARGEMALDEAGRRLFISSEGTGSVEEIPLEAGVVPTATQADIDDATILVMGASGPTYGVLTTGAGGATLDGGAGRWTVPGVIPTAVVDDFTIGTLYEVMFEINEPTHISALRVCPVAGRDILFEYGIRLPTGEEYYRHTESAYAGPVDVFAEIQLPIGRYIMFVQVEDALEFQGVVGFRPWARNSEFYPIYLRAAHAPA